MNNELVSKSDLQAIITELTTELNGAETAANTYHVKLDEAEKRYKELLTEHGDLLNRFDRQRSLIDEFAQIMFFVSECLDVDVATYATHAQRNGVRQLLSQMITRKITNLNSDLSNTEDELPF